ncbi:haloacid dehalogenase-like hydrolase [Moritella marina ATCC 15381]|uniref:Haloacid dehalogenase-like hydrolase n=1 Tax=Moritella marina ATCC 15381 TaxID=1202962 RepID=A0A5J6WLV8_MORMI|nr:haloacid dehalogenase-like hydrolase [Moritella marina]QFI38030.1 haloacid dehalogenase-like hydrolase [Moritella marina ATCC 15381]
MVSIYDLDLTLIRVNSFKHWVIFTLILLPFNLFTFLPILILYCHRCSGLVGRFEFKKRLTTIQSESKYWSIAGFIFSRYLCLFTNKGVLKHLDQPGINIIASAAPDIYGKCLPFLDKFDHVLFSNLSDGYYIELLGDAKKVAVINDMKKNNITLSWLRFYTDSLEDLPLARIVNELYVVYTKEAVFESFKNELADIKVSLLK